MITRKNFLFALGAACMQPGFGHASQETYGIDYAHDIVAWVEKFYNMTTLEHGKTTAMLYLCQKQFLRQLMSYDKTALLGCRQCGKTSMICMFAAHRITFFPNQHIVMFFNKTEAAEEALNRIRFSLSYLPEHMQHRRIVDKSNEIAFANGSSIMAVSYSSANAMLCGRDVNIYIFDEMAFARYSDLIDLILYKDSKIIAVSSAGKNFGPFYDIITYGSNDGWSINKIYWTDIPSHGLEFKHKTVNAIGQSRWQNEYESEFII